MLNIEPSSLKALEQLHEELQPHAPRRITAMDKYSPYFSDQLAQYQHLMNAISSLRAKFRLAETQEQFDLLHGKAAELQKSVATFSSNYGLSRPERVHNLHAELKALTKFKSINTGSVYMIPAGFHN